METQTERNDRALLDYIRTAELTERANQQIELARRADMRAESILARQIARDAATGRMDWKRPARY